MSGFYKIDGDTLHHAIESVFSKDWELHVDTRTEYEYPVAGWYWFDSEAEALSFFNLPLPPPEGVAS